MCPCSQNDPTLFWAWLGAAITIGAYLLFRGRLQTQSRFVRVVGPAVMIVVVTGGVWYAAVATSSDGVCPAPSGFGLTPPAAPLSAASEPASREVEPSTKEIDVEAHGVAPDMPAPDVAPRAETTQPAAAESEIASARTDADQEATESEVKFVAYYFHRTTRCDACLTIEAYTEEAILQNFSEFLEDGRLEWQAVNIEEPGNEHFEDDFQLATQSIVLVEIINAEVVRWKNLEKVWDLLDAPLAFKEYVVEEVGAFLEG